MAKHDLILSAVSLYYDRKLEMKLPSYVVQYREVNGSLGFRKNTLSIELICVFVHSPINLTLSLMQTVSRLI